MSTKSTIFKKVKIRKTIFHRFQNIAQLFGTKTQFSHFLGRGGGVGLHVVNWDKAKFCHKYFKYPAALIFKLFLRNASVFICMQTYKGFGTDIVSAYSIWMLKNVMLN